MIGRDLFWIGVFSMTAAFFAVVGMIKLLIHFDLI